MAAEFMHWHHVPGRGWIAEFASREPERDMAAFRVGGAVEIDGNEYLCTALEYAREGHRVSQKFGVVVRGAPKIND